MTLSIRNLALPEMAFLMEVAHKEGWNPGLYDGAAFFQSDPESFFLAEQNGVLVGGISAHRYAADLVYVGNHFVLPPYRKKGIGKELWEYALGLAGDISAGVSGLPEGRDFYVSYGFRPVTNIIQYSGIMFAEARSSDDIYSVHEMDFRMLLQYDEDIFGFPREAFLKAWLETPVMESVCLLKEGRIQGWGALRRCRRGWRLGPVFAETYGFAEEIVRHLAMKTYTEWVYMDIPEDNVPAIKLAFALGMTPFGARLKMAKGKGYDESLDRVFGFTTQDCG